MACIIMPSILSDSIKIGSYVWKILDIIKIVGSVAGYDIKQ